MTIRPPAEDVQTVLRARAKAMLEWLEANGSDVSKLAFSSRAELWLREWLGQGVTPTGGAPGCPDASHPWNAAAPVSRAPQEAGTCGTCRHKDPHKAFYCKRGVGILYPLPSSASMSLHPKDSFGCTLHAPLTDARGTAGAGETT